MSSSTLQLPFQDLPGPWGPIFWVAFFVILTMFGWNLLLVLRADRWNGRRHDEHDSDVREHLDREFTWYFLVPAKDEERTIADSVGRLAQVDSPNVTTLVINDGSTDSTAERLVDVARPGLEVLTRVPPDAGTGKSAALNAAYQHLSRLVDERGLDRDRVIVCIVDADGRIDPQAPAAVARHFHDDPTIGGVQVLVRIYNRQQLLTRAQDLEFGLMGFLYQSARSTWGTAGMGGNGQFNRLSALDAVADDEGPWKHRLTEDLDLGLRLMRAGWRNVHDNSTHVAQQGVPGIRTLYRQRTRWSQGTLQAMPLIGTARHVRSTFAARIDMVLNLLMPVWQLVVGTAFIGAVYLLLTGQTKLFGGSWLQLLFFYLLGFSGTLIGCFERGRQQGGLRGGLWGLVVAHPYAAYTWLLWPVLVRAIARQAFRRQSWAKTPRVEIPAGE